MNIFFNMVKGVIYLSYTTAYLGPFSDRPSTCKNGLQIGLLPIHDKSNNDIINTKAIMLIQGSLGNPNVNRKIYESCKKNYANTRKVCTCSKAMHTVAEKKS